MLPQIVGEQHLLTVWSCTTGGILIGKKALATMGILTWKVQKIKKIEITSN